MTGILLAKIIIFTLVSGVIIWVSRGALRTPGSHGIYRFLAWEAILIMILLNLEVWFSDPWATNQIISWILLICSLPILYFGVLTLRKKGLL